jgi:flagellar hook protein FlgE
MGGEISTIQSLKAVDAWIDVINANINGGVRTAFKSSRLKFSGTNVDVQRAGTSTALPLQFPESGLNTANTVIDFTQGAITASTENSHLAIQGEGFFVICDPASVDSTGKPWSSTSMKLYLTRDGEFRTNQQGLLVNAAGYYLLTAAVRPGGAWDIRNMRTVYNNIDSKTVPTGLSGALNLTDYLANNVQSCLMADGSAAGYNFAWSGFPTSLAKVTLGRQNLQYTAQGSTVFEFGYTSFDNASGSVAFPLLTQPVSSGEATILNKSLEASNASMTQSVPELSLAQKLFSALTKVLQTKQTNVDGVLNLVR